MAERARITTPTCRAAGQHPSQPPAASVKSAADVQRKRGFPRRIRLTAQSGRSRPKEILSDSEKFESAGNRYKATQTRAEIARTRAETPPQSRRTKTIETGAAGANPSSLRPQARARASRRRDTGSKNTDTLYRRCRRPKNRRYTGACPYSREIRGTRCPAARADAMTIA